MKKLMSEIQRMLIVFLIVLMLSGCGSSGKVSIDDSYSYLGAAVGNKMSVYVSDDNLLHMYVPDGRDDIVLCNKADCTHEPYNESSNSDPVCDAALNDKLKDSCLPVITGEYIYLFGRENMLEGVVYRENLDGSGRVRVYTLNYQINIYSKVYVRDKYAYAEASIPVVEEEEKSGGTFTNKSQTVVVRINLETGEVTELSPVSELKHEYSNMYIIDVTDTDIYIGYRYGINDVYFRVYCYDIKEDKLAVMFDEKELTGMEIIGTMDKALCVADYTTKEAYEINYEDKERTSIYKPDTTDVIYNVYNKRWIISDMDSETSSYIDGDKCTQIDDVAAIPCTLGKYIDIMKEDNTRQVIYGDSIYTDNPKIMLEIKR